MTIESTMELQVDRLVKQTWSKFQSLDASKRYLVAIAGIPGSGKTTLAMHVASGLNRAYHASKAEKFPNQPDYDPKRPNSWQTDIAFIIPLDGFHLTRDELSALPNASDAHYRRGAAFTFNPDLYLQLVTKLRKPIEAATPTIHAPSFDHRIKDPISNDVPIPSTARILLFEGLYAALNRPGWREAHALMDETWFVEVDVEKATERVARRNFAAGLSHSFEEALARTVDNDMRNGREIIAERLKIDEVIKSVDEDSWKTEDIVPENDEMQFDKREAIEKFKRERKDSISELVDSGCGM